MIYIFSIYAFVLGLIIGSFLNCLIWRLYKNETIFGRSYCPKCRQPIAWYDNIPVLSFIFLRGRCRKCAQKISWQYPLVELITALLFLITFLQASLLPNFAFSLTRAWLLIITLLIVFVYDARWQLIPMTIIWPLTVVFFVLNIFLGIPVLTIALSGSILALFFLIQYIVTKKKGLGEGDIWLGLLLGVSFPSFAQIFLILVLAYCFGAVVGLVLMKWKGKKAKTKIALGPFLAFGAIITLIWGEQILAWYFHLFL